MGILWIRPPQILHLLLPSHGYYAFFFFLPSTLLCVLFLFFLHDMLSSLLWLFFWFWSLFICGLSVSTSLPRTSGCKFTLRSVQSSCTRCLNSQSILSLYDHFLHWRIKPPVPTASQILTKHQSLPNLCPPSFMGHWDWPIFLKLSVFSLWLWHQFVLNTEKHWAPERDSHLNLCLTFHLSPSCFALHDWKSAQSRSYAVNSAGFPLIGSFLISYWKIMKSVFESSTNSHCLLGLWSCQETSIVKVTWLCFWVNHIQHACIGACSNTLSVVCIIIFHPPASLLMDQFGEC